MLSSQDVFMARQPIHDRNLKVIGYELLYRVTGASGAGEMNAEARAQALANVLIEIGLDKLVDTKIAFVNVPGSLLHTQALRLLPPERVVLELLEELRFDEHTCAAVKDLSKRGYNLAFDDYTFSPEQEPFVPHVKIIKVDVMLTPLPVLISKTPALKKSGVKLLAEKVETEEMFQTCIELGYDYFQGYFFAKPALVSGKAAPTSRVSTAALIATLNNPESTIDDVEAAIIQDVTLSYRMLKLVNSATFAVQKEITTLRQAVIFLGLDRIAALGTLIAMSSVSGKSDELMTLAAMRARLCEQLAIRLGLDQPKKHFTVGLLSVLDAILDRPMNEILVDLPLSTELRLVLSGLDCDSALAMTLRVARRFERGEVGPELLDVAPSELTRTYGEALVWAQDMRQKMAA